VTFVYGTCKTEVRYGILNGEKAVSCQCAVNAGGGVPVGNENPVSGGGIVVVFSDISVFVHSEIHVYGRHRATGMTACSKCGHFEYVAPAMCGNGFEFIDFRFAQ